MSDEQDIRKMGGIYRLIPFTFAVMVIGNLALTGVPPFAGFFSKDMVIEATHAAGTGVGNYAFGLLIIAAFLTSFYSWRLMFMTFFGKPRADHHTMEHVHESPLIMTIPLAALAFGAVFAGFIGYEHFVGEGRGEFWGAAIAPLAAHDSIAAVHAHHPPFLLKWLPLFVTIAGFGLAFLMYVKKPELPARLVAAFPGVYKFLLNKWYFDELYNVIFVRPAFALGRIFWKRGDTGIIDRFGPDGIAALSTRAARRLGAVQSGYLYHYAFAMIVGIAVIVSWFVVGRE